MIDDLISRLRDPASIRANAWTVCDEAAEALILLRDALTPSGDTKAAYMGEFAFNLTRVDEAGDEYPEKVYVPWTTIKEIMAAIRERALTPTKIKKAEVK